MNKSYFFVALLLAGGFTGCIASDDEGLTGMSISEAAYLMASKVIVKSFNEIFYDDVCERLMYEDGSFYNDDDVSKCVKGAEKKYMGESNSNNNSNSSDNSEYNAFLAPDWEYINFDNTGKEAALTGMIYRVSGVGIYCEPEEHRNYYYEDEKEDCKSKRVLDLYMAMNTKSGDWGYAAEGFRTTDGNYLQVVIPEH